MRRTNPGAVPGLAPMRSEDQRLKLRCRITVMPTWKTKAPDGPDAQTVLDARPALRTLFTLRGELAVSRQSPLARPSTVFARRSMTRSSNVSPLPASFRPNPPEAICRLDNHLSRVRGKNPRSGGGAHQGGEPQAQCQRPEPESLGQPVGDRTGPRRREPHHRRERGHLRTVTWRKVAVIMGSSYALPCKAARHINTRPGALGAATPKALADIRAAFGLVPPFHT
jgi:hypothetical protein